MNPGPFFISLAASLWAIDALIRTPLTRVLPATTIVFWEHVIGLFLLSPLFWKSRNLFTKLTHVDWFNIVALTIVSSIGGTVLFTLALEKSFATGDFVTPLLLQKTQPLIVILLSALFLKEKLSKKYLLFAPLALIGSYLMSFGFAPMHLQFAGRELVFALAIGAAASWGSGTIFSKKLLVKLSFVESTCIRFLVAIPLGCIATLLFHQVPTVSSLTTDVFFRFILIGLATGAGALLIYYKGLAKTEAHISTIAELAFPFVSILIGITALNPYGAPQTLSAAHIVGILLLLSSVIVISWDYAKKTSRRVIVGTVVRGAGDGKKLGFPTANIQTTQTLQIPYGVYACLFTIDKKSYPAILHYGPRIIFGETKPQIEVHIFDFKKSLYGKTVTVEVNKHIRSTQNFSSLEHMKRQIQQDISRAKKHLKA